MSGFSLSNAWNEGVAFVRNNLQMVLIWAAIGVLVPALLQLVLVGGVVEQQAMMEQFMRGGDPDAMLAAMGGGVVLLSLLTQIVSTASYFGAWRMGLAREAVAPPQAATYALAAAVTSLIVIFVVIIGLVLVIALPLGLLGAAFGLGSDGPSAGGALAGVGIALLLMLLLIPFFLWLMARLSVMGPVMARAGSVNPLYGIAQSWQLTRPAQWPIFGYILLLIIALFVVGMVIALISGVGMIASGGLGGGEVGTGTLLFTTLLGAIISIPLAAAYIGVPAGIYRALNPDPVAEVFE